MVELVGTKLGPCPLCVGPKEKDKEKKLYVVRGGAYSGAICHDHLHVLMTSQNGAKTDGQ